MLTSVRFRKVSVFLTGLFVMAVPALAQSNSEPVALALCLRPQVDTPLEVLPATTQELRQYRSVLNAPIEFNCERPDAIAVILEPRPRTLPSDVLAAVPRVNGRILPELHIFTDAVSSLLPIRSVSTLSRALALVIAHECLHYIQQDALHQTHGVQMAAFSSRDLQRGAQWWTSRASLEAAVGQ